MPLCYNAALLKALMDKTAQQQSQLIKRKRKVMGKTEGEGCGDYDDEAEAFGETAVAQALAAVEEEALSPASRAVAALKAVGAARATKDSKKKKGNKTRRRTRRLGLSLRRSGLMRVRVRVKSVMTMRAQPPVMRTMQTMMLCPIRRKVTGNLTKGQD